MGRDGSPDHPEASVVADVAPLLGRLRAVGPADCPILALRDRRLLGWAALWSVVAFVAYGLVAAIIPNPVFGRQVPPTVASIWIWIVSAPLIGLVTATYTAPIRPNGVTPLVMLGSGTPVGAADASANTDDRGGVLGTIGSFGAFLAIGCPVCNKIALVLLGTSGALSVWAPIQPLVGAASLALLAATLVWRLRLRARGGACSV